MVQLEEGEPVRTKTGMGGGREPPGIVVCSTIGGNGYDDVSPTQTDAESQRHPGAVLNFATHENRRSKEGRVDV